jgi:large subunit ribosomal protein L4
VVTDAFDLEAPKTRMLAGKLKELGLESVLILVEAFDEKLFLASRNLPTCRCCRSPASIR